MGGCIPKGTEQLTVDPFGILVPEDHTDPTRVKLLIGQVIEQSVGGPPVCVIAIYPAVPGGAVTPV